MIFVRFPILKPTLEFDTFPACIYFCLSQIFPSASHLWVALLWACRRSIKACELTRAQRSIESRDDVSSVSAYRSLVQFKTTSSHRTPSGEMFSCRSWQGKKSSSHLANTPRSVSTLPADVKHSVHQAFKHASHSFFIFNLKEEPCCQDTFDFFFFLSSCCPRYCTLQRPLPIFTVYHPLWSRKKHLEKALFSFFFFLQAWESGLLRVSWCW